MCTVEKIQDLFSCTQVLCFLKKDSLCISEEKYISAVLKTSESIENVKSCDKVRELQIITDIYKAASALKATDIDLLQFTSIALHNMYGFKKFVSVNEANLDIRVTSRGLLQLRSYDSYLTISNISKFEYTKKPYLLDQFSTKSIFDEFSFYMKNYSKINLNSTKVSSFLIVVQLLNPDEAYLINNMDLESVKCKPANTLTLQEKRLLKRIRIHNCLFKNMFPCGKLNSFAYID
jgi:hypothetical protein